MTSTNAIQLKEVYKEHGVGGALPLSKIRITFGFVLRNQSADNEWQVIFIVEMENY